MQLYNYLIHKNLAKREMIAIFVAKEDGKIDTNVLARLVKMSHDHAHDHFLEMKQDYLEKVDEDHGKYAYALQLRQEATSRIGIANIREARAESLAKEKAEMEIEYQAKKQICPSFRLELLVRMERSQ